MDAATAERILVNARLEKESALRSVQEAMKEVERLRSEADKAEAEQRANAENRNRQRQALYAGNTSGSVTASSNASSSSSSSSSSSTTLLSSALEHEADSLALELEEATQAAQLRNDKIAILFSVDLLGNDTAPDVVVKPRSRLTITFQISSKVIEGVTSMLDGGEGGGGGGRNKGSEEEYAVTDPGENDYIGLYLCGTPRTSENASSSHLALEYTDGKRSGDITLTLPSDELKSQLPHNFEFWYVHQSGRVLAFRGPVHMRNKVLDQESKTISPLSPPSLTSSTTYASTIEGDKQHPGLDSSEDALPIILLDKMYPNTNNNGSNSSSISNALQPKLGVRVFRPPFLLQKLVRISAYQVYIPLPRHLRTVRSGADPLSSESERTSAYLRLPEKWSPGVAIEGDSSAELYDGLHPTMHVLFELPQISRSSASSLSPHGVCAYDATATEICETTRNRSISEIAALPRDLFRLSLRLQHRVERTKCTMRILSDHIVLRLPMYYGGAALPDRPTSLISLEEMLSLRRQGTLLSCRECSNRLLRSTTTDVSPQVHPNGMRAFVLPSEYWLEWSDFWLCHESQMNVLIPDVDFGAMQGVLLVGETHLQAHPTDFVQDSIYIRPIHAPRSSDATDVSNETTSDFAFCSIECSRCSSSLGTTHCAIPRGARTSSYLTLTPTSASTHEGAFLAKSTQEWGSRLSPDSDPVIRLHKDRISVPNDAELNESLTKVYNDLVQKDSSLSPSSSSLLTASTTPAPRSRNALRNYSVCSRLAADLLAASHSRAQYKFLLVASDVDISTSQSSQQQRHQYPSNIRIAVTLVNWNISIRGAAQHSEWSESEGQVSGGGGGGGGGGGRGGGRGGGVRRWLPHSHPGADVPALQVLFHVISDPEMSDSEAAVLDDWQGSSVSAATAVPLLSDEIDTVTAVLLESCLLLPREAQTPPQIGRTSSTQSLFRVGFLPLLENIR